MDYHEEEDIRWWNYTFAPLRGSYLVAAPLDARESFGVVAKLLLQPPTSGTTFCPSCSFAPLSLRFLQRLFSSLL